MPISADGPDILDATIDAENVQEITIDGETFWTASALTVTATLNGRSATFVVESDTGTKNEYPISDGENNYDINMFDFDTLNSLYYYAESDNNPIENNVIIERVEMKY